MPASISVIFLMLPILHVVSPSVPYETLEIRKAQTEKSLACAVNDRSVQMCVSALGLTRNKPRLPGPAKMQNRSFLYAGVGPLFAYFRG